MQMQRYKIVFPFILILQFIHIKHKLSPLKIYAETTYIQR